MDEIKKFNNFAQNLTYENNIYFLICCTILCFCIFPDCNLGCKWKLANAYHVGLYMYSNICIQCEY